MESLEDRRLLAVTVGNDGDLINGNVDSIADLIAADGGDGISLREAITAANNTAGVDVIEFAPQVKGTISLTNGQLDVTDELTINGPGRNSLTVSGNQLSRVFNIESTVSINNMTIADGLVLGEGSGFGSSLPGGMGGAVFVSSDGDLSLNRVTATKNQVNGNLSDDGSGRGGAIYVDAGGVLDVSHSTFSGNQATGNRAGAGGAIFVKSGGTLSVEDSEFTHNQARTNVPGNESGGFPRFCDVPTPGLFCSFFGGAITYEGSGATISGTRFIENHTSSVGTDLTLASAGALSGGFDIDKSRFEGNSARAGLQATGGAIGSGFFASTSVTDSTFMGNSVVADVDATGGAISVGFLASLDVADSRFIRNSASGGELARGGAITVDIISAANITGSQFVGNTASSDVLAVGGAIANMSGSTLTVDHSSIVNNQANSADDAFGGGIYNDGADRTVFGFIQGTSNVTLTHSNVNANQANGGSGGSGVGGGVYDAGNENVDTFFVNDHASIRGNKASTSDDDVFGDLTFLDDLLALV